MAGVGAGVWVALALGFRWHDDPSPPGLQAGLGPALLVLLLTLAAGVRRLLRARGTTVRGAARTRPTGPGPVPTRAASPVPAWLSLPPGPCVHLQPVAQGMEAAGIPVVPAGPAHARADCHVGPVGLASRHPLPPCVAYEERHQPERSLRDPPEARLHCRACGSMIWLRHPDDGGPRVPTYPPAAG